MNTNLVEKVKQEQEYKILIRNLRKMKEEKGDEKTNDKKTVVLCQDLVQVKMRNFSPF